MDIIFPFHNYQKAPLLFDGGLLCLLLAELSKIFVSVSPANDRAGWKKCSLTTSCPYLPPSGVVSLAPSEHLQY